MVKKQRNAVMSHHQAGDFRVKHTKQQLEQLYMLPIHEACLVLNLSIQEMTQTCRFYNIKRWPYTKFTRRGFKKDHISGFSSFNYSKNSPRDQKNNKYLIPYCSTLEFEQSYSSPTSPLEAQQFSFQFTKPAHSQHVPQQIQLNSIKVSSPAISNEQNVSSSKNSHTRNMVLQEDSNDVVCVTPASPIQPHFFNANLPQSLYLNSRFDSCSSSSVAARSSASPQHSPQFTLPSFHELVSMTNVQLYQS